MEKPIVTALFIVVSMILVAMLFNAVYPAIQQGGDAVSSMTNGVIDRMRDNISIVHASPDFDPTWCPPAGCDVSVWVKNIGQARIIGLNSVDVFFGPEGNFTRIPYSADGTGGVPSWTTPGVAGGGDWVPTGTLQIIVHYAQSAPVSSGRYFIKVVLPDGVSSDYFLGI